MLILVFILFFYISLHLEKTNYFAMTVIESQNNSLINNQLLRIARFLMLNTGFLHDISLCHGKMGIAIFFFQYA